VLFRSSEGFGLTYIEAISNAMPIATYANLYGAQELVHEGVNGHLAMFSHKKADEAANVKQLAEAMRHVFEHYNELLLGVLRWRSALTIKRLLTNGKKRW